MPLGILLESAQFAVDCRCAQAVLNAEQAVIFAHSLTAGRGTGLDLPGTGGHSQIGNGGILGLTAAMGDDSAVARRSGDLHGLHGLGKCADLIGLDQNGIGSPLANALSQSVRIGDKQIVPHDL